MFTKILLASFAFVSQAALADVPTPPDFRLPQAHVVEYAALSEGDIDPVLLGAYDFVEGRVWIEYGSHDLQKLKPLEIHLSIFRSKRCAPGAACTQEMALPVDVRLPVTEVSHGFFGGRIIRASADLRPVDGQMKEIILSDSRDARGDQHRIFATEVQYNTSLFDLRSSRESSTSSVLRGKALQQLSLWR